MCHAEVGERFPLSVSIFWEKSIYLVFSSHFGQNCSSGGMSSKRSKGSVGGGEAGKKAKTTPDAHLQEPL